LPWYSLLLWPPFCLICGPVFARLLGQVRPRGLLGRLPWFWAVLGAVLLLASLLMPSLSQAPAITAARWLPLPAGLGLLLGGVNLASRPRGQRRLGMLLLLLGWCSSLLLFCLSPFWNWELNEDWSVLPAAELAREAGRATGDAGLPLYMPGNEGQRPSLRWYAEREIFNLPDNPGDRWPRRFRVLLQGDGGIGTPLPGTPERLRIQDASCDLEARGDDSWELWLCRGPANAADPAP
jgi:hypothetical protein